MTELTFLSAANGKPLVKTFSATEKKSYPNIAKFNSRVEEIEISFDGLEHLTEILRAEATAGNCLLKGPLLTPLVKERRKGLHDKDAATQLLVLDIDGINVPFDLPDVMDANALRTIDVLVMNHLPTELQTVAHIIQASASLGMKKRNISCHLYFFLSEEVHPRILKDYLTGLNLDEGFFQEQLGLTATGMAMTYGIDRALADNSRLIYLGTPQFQGIANPFPNDDDRIVFIPGTQAVVDSTALLQTSSAVITQKQMKALNDLRVSRGLSKKHRIKLDSVLVDGERIPVLAEPEKARMLMCEDEGEFVRYNLNGGDSNAYWVFKHQPEIVHNFKGEPAFRFKDVDSEGYEEHIRRFRDEEADEPDFAIAPLAFIDWHSQPHWGLVQAENDEIIRLEPCKREAIRDLYAQYSLSTPENLPVYDYSFRPHDDRVFDREGKFINKYRMPALLRKPPAIDEKYHGGKIGYFTEATDLFPTVYKLLYSVCGCDDDGTGSRELEYFINWLAYIVQNRRKTLTAWVFHGTQGTGKGLLFDQVLTPLLGEDYATMKRTQDLDDFFNGYIERTLLIAVDEFRTEGKGVKTDLTNKLKNMITEEVGTVRAMRTDQYTVDLYTNFMFFSNDKDAVKIPGDDRRFNVAPRQERRILDRFPNIIKEMDANIKKEVPLFASYLLHYDVSDEYVKTPLENTAKEAMREASATSIDQFVEALVDGNLDYFLQVMDETPTGYDNYVDAAQNIIKSVIKNYEEGVISKMWLADIRPLYNVLIGRQDNMIKLGKLLAHHNLDTKKVRRDKQIRKGIEVSWHLKDHDITFLQHTYLTPEERQGTKAEGEPIPIGAYQ